MVIFGVENLIRNGRRRIMDNQQEILSKEIQELLLEVILLLGDLKYSDLEKSLNIVSQRNYKQYPSLKNKIGDVIMRIYNTRIYNQENIIVKLDKIYRLV